MIFFKSKYLSLDIVGSGLLCMIVCDMSSCLEYKNNCSTMLYNRCVIFTPTRTYTDSFIHAPTCPYTSIHSCTQTCDTRASTHTQIHKQTRIHVHEPKHTYMHTLIRQTHRHTNKHTHTRIHAPAKKKQVLVTCCCSSFPWMLVGPFSLDSMRCVGFRQWFSCTLCPGLAVSKARCVM